jgi:hypothetical protein
LTKIVVFMQISLEMFLTVDDVIFETSLMSSSEHDSPKVRATVKTAEADRQLAVWWTPFKFKNWNTRCLANF